MTGRWIEKVLWLSLVGVWVSHALQLFTPETGFDALWYHLPVAKAYVQHGGPVYVPELYQSVNPFFSDGFFILGYAVFGEFGTKIVAYGFGLAALLLTITIARTFLSKQFVLYGAIVVSLIHVVAWQSASFYVDVAKAVWELGAVYVLFVAFEKKTLSYRAAALVGLLIGASLATKAFSLLLLPFFMIAVGHFGWRRLIAFISCMLAVTSPFYAFAYIHTGDAFYSVTHHLGKLHEIGGTDSPSMYLLTRTLTLPYSFVALVTARDYISPILVACVPLLWLFKGSIRKNLPLLFLTSFAAYQWLVWWYVPPTSTRYALSGFIVLVLLIVWAMEKYTNIWPNMGAKLTVFVIASSILLTLVPRLYVNTRSLNYILRHQSKQEYLEQFRDGNIDRHIDAWYGITSD